MQQPWGEPRVATVDHEVAARLTRRTSKVEIPHSAQTKRHYRGASGCNCIRLLDAHVATRGDIEEVDEPLRISGVVDTNLRNIETRACVDDEPVTNAGCKPVVRPVLAARHVDEDDLALHRCHESDIPRDCQRHELLIRSSTEHHRSRESTVRSDRDSRHVRPEVWLRPVVLIFDRQKHRRRFILARNVGETREWVALDPGLVGRFDVDRRRTGQLEHACLDMADSPLLSRHGGNRGKRQRGANERDHEIAELEQHDSCPPESKVVESGHAR